MATAPPRAAARLSGGAGATAPRGPTRPTREVQARERHCVAEDHDHATEDVERAAGRVVPRLREDRRLGLGSRRERDTGLVEGDGDRGERRLIGEARLLSLQLFDLGADVEELILDLEHVADRGRLAEQRLERLLLGLQARDAGAEVDELAAHVLPVDRLVVDVAQTRKRGACRVELLRGHADRELTRPRPAVRARRLLRARVVEWDGVAGEAGRGRRRAHDEPTVRGSDAGGLCERSGELAFRDRHGQVRCLHDLGAAVCRHLGRSVRRGAAGVECRSGRRAGGDGGYATPHGLDLGVVREGGHRRRRAHDGIGRRRRSRHRVARRRVERT